MNNFFTLCVTVCLSIFFVTTLTAVVLLNFTAPLLRYHKVQSWLVSVPAFFFWVRISPFLLGIVSVVGFALPSFLLLEPRRTTERPDAVLLILAALAAALLIILMARCCRLFWTTRRSVQHWQNTGQKLSIPGVWFPVRAAESPKSLIAVAGLVRPQVFVGKDVLTQLSQDELRAAIAHEAAHVRSFDNLKQFILRVTRLPECLRQFGWMDSEWSSAVEFAADEEALRSGTPALDLGSALIKVARLSDTKLQSSFLAASHLIPPDCSSAIGLRIQHLQSRLRGINPSPRSRAASRISSVVVLAISAFYVAILPSSLPIAHKVIEWLVR